MPNTSKKRAFTLVEMLICTALLTMLVYAAVMITGVTNYAIADSVDEFDKMNGYDIFLDAYTDSVKNAIDVSVTNGTHLYTETPSGSHSFEFDRNRMIMDGEELFKAKKGQFFYNGQYVTLSMAPEGYGDVELTIYIDRASY